MGALKLTYQSYQDFLHYEQEKAPNLRVVPNHEPTSNLDKNYYVFGMNMPGRTFAAEIYRYGFQGQESDDEIKGSTGTSYEFGARMYDPRLGRFLSIDPATNEFPSLSPYIGMNDNPINGTDKDGKRYVPINEVLGNYGYKSKEEQLFPDPTGYDVLVEGLTTVANILDPSSPVKVSILGEVYKKTMAIKKYTAKDIKDADRSRVQEYYNNIKTIESDLTSRIDEVNLKIEKLEKAETESGSTGFNRKEIASQVKYRWKLEDQLNTIQVEIKEAEPILEEPIIYE